jgi:hypothetical protein
VPWCACPWPCCHVDVLPHDDNGLGTRMTPLRRSIVRVEGETLATDLQRLGAWGERQVVKQIDCLVCHQRGLVQLASGFPSLDLVCRNCAAYMAQVKTVRVGRDDPMARPTRIRGAGWKPLQLQIAVGQLRDLYVVGAAPRGRGWTLAWIDRVPGPSLLANAYVFEHRVANIGGGTRRHPMFTLVYAQLPPACVLTVYP